MSAATAPIQSFAPSSTADWHQANKAYLSAALAEVRACLRDDEDERDAARRARSEAAAALPAPAAIDHVTQAFGLSPFERDVLLLCAGVELEASVGDAIADAHGDAALHRPTFGLALSRLPDAHWSALSPAGPLRRWRLIELERGDSLTADPLRADERLLHHLAGAGYLDDRLEALLTPISPALDVLDSHERAAERLTDLWSAAAAPPVQILGAAAGARVVVAAAAARLGALPLVLRSADVPTTPAEREELLRLWEREMVLGGTCLVLEGDQGSLEAPALSLLARVGGPVAIVGCRPVEVAGRPVARLELSRPGAAEQVALWRTALGDHADGLDGELRAAVEHFSLDADAIRGAALRALGGEGLWSACRLQSRPAIDDLAERIDSSAGWEDLVLPAAQREMLGSLARHVRRRATVHESWGFAARSRRGLGITALFAGGSGTGKTLAAEVLGGELALDLYRIDLSAVVSKYIGETEKHLRRVFEAAEAGGAILLFDEADALFGRRSEVRDSHDRFANIEVSYLLQRMEAYRGLAILTTNLKAHLDPAFLRRLRFVVHFPFPAAAQRAEIWRRVFPPATPVGTLDLDCLAQLDLTGSSIRSIALGAAFLAADAGEPVQMSHLLAAARAESAKLERPLSAAELEGWS